MGIYIKDMKMPTTCEECRYFIKTRNLIDLDYRYHCINGASALVFPNVYENRAFDCPLIDVQEPHGRLIDGDVLLEESMKDGAFNYVDSWQIADAPTIIKGSE